MTAEKPNLDTIVCEAVEIAAADEREAYIAQACGGDHELRARADKLVDAHFRAGNFLESPVLNLAAAADELPGGEGPGTVIGHYKLLEQIGEGGFGVVFMAEQTQPVRRKVALKVLKPGMDTRQVVARFEAERQALAIMDHPNIARVFDGGTTPSVRPYFVMELVKGLPITEFCDQNCLTPRQRLELFVSVCQAVQHAHQKGIIHRDLKPSNILVTVHDTTPVVKVIDFGVAKALGQELTDKTLFTGFAQMVGTPLYMSPEQAGQSGLDIDTRSDIYSLGVLLYELLTGTTPFDKERFKQAAYDEICRIIREEEPPKPSTRLSESKDTLVSLSAHRQTEPTKLTRLVRGELDWIVMKALEKDRNRRYETAANFARDVQRYLRCEPVEACPPSRRYRLRKFVRRNREAVLAGCLVLLVLLFGLMGTTWGMARAEQQRLLAEANEQKAINAAGAEREAREAAQEQEAETHAVLDFVERRLLAAARPQKQAGGLGRDVSLRQAIELALPYALESFADQPLIEARLRMVLGISFAHLGDAGSAEAQCLRARELYTAKLGPNDPKTLSSLNNLAICYKALGRHTQALKLHEETLALRRTHLAPGHSDTLTSMVNVANSYFSLHRHEEALELRKEILPLQSARRGPHHRDTLRSTNNLANSYHALRRLGEALELYEKTLQLQTVHLGADHPDLLTTRMNLANCLRDLGRASEALVHEEATLRLKQVKFGLDHPETLASTINLGTSYAVLGRHAEALKLREETLRLLKVKRGPDHPHTLGCMWNVAASLVDLGRDDEAVPVIDECLRRAAGKAADPSLVPEVVTLRLRIFQKKQDAAGCRATAELWEKLSRADAESLYLAARIRAITAAVVSRKPQSPGSEAARLADQEADRALDWLRKAVAAGFKNTNRMTNDPDLESLRKREDFQRLLADLEASKKASGVRNPDPKKQPD